MANSNFYNNNTISSYYNNSSNHGSYQYQTLDELVNTFMVIYVGENKIIPKADRNDVYFFGRRALQEMNYDVLRSKKTWEFELDNRMYIPMPHDFVGYTNVFRVDANGIKLPLYPTKDTQNPFRPKPALPDNEHEALIRKQYGDINVELPNSIDDWWETAYEGPPTEIVLDCRDVEIVLDGNKTTPATSNCGYDGYASFSVTGTNDWELLGIQNLETQEWHENGTLGNNHTYSIKIIDNGTGCIHNLNFALGGYPCEDGIYGHGSTVDPTGLQSSTELNPVYTGIVADNTDDEAGLHATGYNLDSNGDPVLNYTSTTLSNFRGSESNVNMDSENDGEIYQQAFGQRFGLDPARSQNNGSYYFDYANGRLYFGPSLIGETLVLDYITDGLAEGGDALIHKFAEEAWYKHVAYGIVSTGSNYSPATVQMLKKERFAETRKAKLRLSNLKLQEMEQIMRGKSKWIKS